MERDMETQELHRGRLIDHIQLVVRDLKASQEFYEAVVRTPFEATFERELGDFQD